jgi:hypothetical protein
MMPVSIKHVAVPLWSSFFCKYEFVPAKGCFRMKARDEIALRDLFDVRIIDKLKILEWFTVQYCHYIWGIAVE